MKSFRRKNTLKKSIIFVISFLITAAVGFAQEDTLSKRKNRYVLLPATAYSPESGFTIGGLGSIFVDFAKGDTNSRMSRFSVLSIITTKKQLYLGTDYEIFTPNEKYAISGLIQFKKEVDRHYGIGNNVTERVYKIDEETGDIKDEPNNYLNFKVRNLTLRLNVYKRLNNDLKKRWFGGLASDFVHNYQYEPNAMEIPLTAEIPNVPVAARVMGLGAGINYDSRTNNNNPLSGTYIQLRTLQYFEAIGSEYTYNSLILDARYYWNPIKKQTLALRFATDQRFHKHDVLPLYSLAKVGGKEFVRGYFEGTYRDNHALALEAEYRVPFFQKADSKIWQFWHRLGFTIFASTAKVYPDWNTFDLNDFRFTAGFGGRYMLDFSQRVNLRIDIAWGLDPLSGGDDIQRSIYFFIAEAF